MYWQNWNDFFAMGGYAPYVWGAYAVAALCIAVELFCLARRAGRARQK